MKAKIVNALLLSCVAVPVLCVVLWENISQWSKITPVHAQYSPACSFSGVLAAPGTSIIFDNRTLGCYQWRVSYVVNYSVTVLSVQLESAPDNGGVPGSWSAMTGVVDGTNPDTTVIGDTIGIHATGAWIRFNYVSMTGAGNLNYQVWGANSTGTINSAGGSGGSGGTGPTGPKGATGTTGVAGATGTTGVAGATGTTGVAGATGATGQIIGELTDATPGATPSYNFVTGVAGGTSTASNCTAIPCGAVYMTLSANSTAPTFTFSSLGGGWYSITVNQGGTAYTGFTWPSNIIGAVDVTQNINKYTTISGYYDTNKAALIVTAVATNDFSLVKTTTQPTGPPTNTGDCWNYLDTSYGVGSVWCANSHVPIANGVANFSIRRVNTQTWNGANAYVVINDTNGVTGALGATGPTATIPSMGTISVANGSVVGISGGSTNITGRTHGMILQCGGSQTVITALRTINCGYTNGARAGMAASDNAAAAQISAFVGYSSTGTNCYAASSTDFVFVTSNGAACHGVDTGVPVVANTFYRFTVYEDIANSEWWGCVNSTCVSNATDNPATATALNYMSIAWGIGAASGVWYNAYIQSISDYN